MITVEQAHPSHDWYLIEPNWPGQMCHRCEICTCHQEAAAIQPCTEPASTPERTDARS